MPNYNVADLTIDQTIAVKGTLQEAKEELMRLLPQRIAKYKKPHKYRINVYYPSEDRFGDESYDLVSGDWVKVAFRSNFGG